LREKLGGREATRDEQMNERGNQERVPSGKMLLHTKNDDKNVWVKNILPETVALNRTEWPFAA
jgi:hypothetical protein